MTDAVTVSEACARWGWSRRTFARYIAGGLKATAVRASDGAKLYKPALKTVFLDAEIKWTKDGSYTIKGH